jgi:DNA-binding MarR family transcriptional regulator
MPDDELLATRAEAFGVLFVLMQHLSRRADSELAGLGLTTRQWLLLAVLTNGFPGHSPSLSEAAEKYGSSRQNVKQVALGLEARGFVRLVADPADARTTRIELTHRVREFDEPRMVERTQGMLDDVFVGLTPDETGELLALLRRWLAGLATSMATPPKERNSARDVARSRTDSVEVTS